MGDVVIAEPLIRASPAPRVIENTVRENCRGGFKRAQFTNCKGAVDT